MKHRQRCYYHNAENARWGGGMEERLRDIAWREDGRLVITFIDNRSEPTFLNLLKQACGEVGAEIGRSPDAPYTPKLTDANFENRYVTHPKLDRDELPGVFGSLYTHGILSEAELHRTMEAFDIRPTYQRDPGKRQR